MRDAKDKNETYSRTYIYRKYIEAMNTIIIYTTHPNLKTAKKIVASLLKLRLIACANFFPIQSAYWWKNKIKHSKEIVSVMKTSRKNWATVKSEIIKQHPYQTPCVMKIDVEANAEFTVWINQETK